MFKKLFSEEWNNLSPEVKSKELLNEYGANEFYFVHIDDDKDVLDSLAYILEPSGFKILSSTDTTQAIEFIEANQNRIAFVFIDLNMPTMNGLEFRKMVQELNPQIPVAILSGNVDRDLALKGIELKINLFIEKGPNVSKTLELIYNHCLERLNQIKDDQELLMGFISDSENLVEQIEENTLSLEENPNDMDQVSKIFGMVHTIKGASGFFNPKTLHKYVHRFEEILKKIQAKEIPVNAASIEVILKSLDWIKVFIDELKYSKFKVPDFDLLFEPFLKIETGAGKVSDIAEKVDDPLAINKTKKSKEEDVIKVQVYVLDEFMQTSGQMTVVRNMINKVVKGIEKTYTGDKDILLLSDLLEELHKTNFVLQNKISDLRKVPVRSLIKPLQRVVRDTSGKLGKSVEFSVSGEELRVDTSIAEMLSNSLIHLIRNSLDHGIETPDQREQVGKNPKGQVHINFRQQDENVFVEITDDGKGINTDIIKEKLLSNNNYDRAVIHKMDEQELMMQIFASGFSTAKEITDISGRGVGMSMVKDSIENIGGRISIDSKRGAGTKFTLKMPLPKSVLIMNSLFVRVDGHRFGIPQDKIQKVLQLEGESLKLFRNLEGSISFEYNSILIPVLFLGTLLNLDIKEKINDPAHLILVNTQSGYIFGLLVDEVLDVEDTVVKNILEKVNPQKAYLGATFLGDGRVGLIISTDGLAAMGDIAKISQKKISTEKNTEVLDTKMKVEKLISFSLGINEVFAVKQSEVFRVEEIQQNNIQYSASGMSIPYRNSLLEIFYLDQLLGLPIHENLRKNELKQCLVFQFEKIYIGIILDKILDILESQGEVMDIQSDLKGIAGAYIVNKQTITLINTHQLFTLSFQKRQPDLDVSA